MSDLSPTTPGFTGERRWNCQWLLYKRSIWFSYLDDVIAHMCYKFSGAAETAILLLSVLTCEKIQIEHFKKCLLCMANNLAALKKYCSMNRFNTKSTLLRFKKPVKLSVSQSAHIWEWVQWNEMTYLTKERDKTVAKHRGCKCWMNWQRHPNN